MKNLPSTSFLFPMLLFAACAKHSGDIPAVRPGVPPLFETRREIVTGTGTHADYVVADFDGNTTLDMAVISLTGEVRVLLGNGSDFTLGQELQIGGLPIWITSGDFDGDGDSDLVVVRSQANSTDVLVNDGNGNFTAGAQLPVGAEALAVVAGDIDDDGNLDVLVSQPIAPEIRVFVGDGTGQFTAGGSVGLPGGGSAFNLALGDATHDGVTDLIVAEPLLSRVLVFVGQGYGGGVDVFGSPALDLRIDGTPRAVSVGDLSGDGMPDLAVSAFESRRFVVVTHIHAMGEGGKGGGGGIVGFDAFEVEVSGPPSISTIADVTNDGLNDLVACLGGNASMVIAPGLAGGGVGEPSQLDATGLPLRPFVGDFEGDGRNDLFALSGLGDRVNLWVAREDNGVLIGARNFDAGLPGASWMAGGDFDGDGDQEVVVGTFQSTRLSLLELRDGKLQQPAAGFTIELGLPVFQIEAANLDFDGKPDLIVAVAGGLKVLRNISTTAGYAFELLPGSPTSTIGTSTGPFGIAVADLDRDGDLDLVACDYAGGNVHVVPGTETPFQFGSERILELGGGPADVAAVDVSGDGLLDLVVSRVAQADLVVLTNTGSGFVLTQSIPVGQSPNYLLTSDFNRDGRADLVVSNGSSGTVTVLFATNNGFSGVDLPAGDTPTALLADDLTGDGLPDVLVTSLSSGDFRVLTGNGRGSFPALVRFPGTFGASDALLQDMDGDGRSDLLIASLITSRVSMVKNVTPLLVD
jgi:hypothetical protein